MKDSASQASARRSAAAADESTEWIRSAMSRYETPLIHYAARLLAGDADRARDVVQDAFVKLLTVDRSNVNEHVGPWLYRVCRNAALDVRRKEARMTTLTSDRPDDRSSVSEQLPATTQGVLSMLEELPEKQQEVIRLKFQGGLSYREIATVMDMTVNHVGVLIHNGLKTIRERICGDQTSQQHTGREIQKAR